MCVGWSTEEVTNKGTVVFPHPKPLLKSTANSTVKSAITTNWVRTHVYKCQTTLLRTIQWFVKIGLVFVRLRACASAGVRVCVCECAIRDWEEHQEYDSEGENAR